MPIGNFLGGLVVCGMVFGTAAGKAADKPAAPAPVDGTVGPCVAGAAADSLLKQVQRVYVGAGDFSASFSQVRRDKLRGRQHVESGHLWAKKDGRVRWTYVEPERKDFVYDGKAAYFYEPLNAQVTVFDRFADSPLANAVQFLWGQGRLTDVLVRDSCDALADEVAESVVNQAARVVALRPKTPIASVQRVYLVIDHASHRVSRSVLLDPLGNRTDYIFSDVRLGGKVSDDKFNFTVPDGVAILRATLDNSASTTESPARPD